MNFIGMLFRSNLIYALLLAVIFLLLSYYVIPTSWPNDKVWTIVTHEIGFAFLVAATIWLTFDVFSQIETEDHWNDRIDKISKNVFLGVFKKNFPDELIREANRLLLDQSFVRSSLHMTYTISDEEFVDHNGQKCQFVKLNAIATFKIRNISNDEAKLNVGIALPNPMVNEMKEFCKLNRIVITQGEVVTTLSLEDAEKKFREDIMNDDVSQVPMHITDISLAANEQIDALFDYNMAKEQEDTELFTTLFPAESVDLTILDKGSRSRVVRARAIHPRSLTNNSSKEAPGTYNFKLTDYLLPQQGFLIWWKNKPDRGKASAAGT